MNRARFPCLLCDALLIDSSSLQSHLADHHQVLSVEGLFLLTNTGNLPPVQELPTTPIVRCPLCEAVVKTSFFKTHLIEHHQVLTDQHNAFSAKYYGLLMRAKPYVFPSNKTVTTPATPNAMVPTASPHTEPRESPAPVVVEEPEQLEDDEEEERDEKPVIQELEQRAAAAAQQPEEEEERASSPAPNVTISPNQNETSSPIIAPDGDSTSPAPTTGATSTPVVVTAPSSTPTGIKEEVLDDGGGSSDEGEQPSPMETNQDIAPATFKGTKSWLTEPVPQSSQSYRLVPMYRGFVYNTPPPVPAHPTTSSPSPVVTASQQQPPPAANSDFGGASNADPHGHTTISFYEGQSFANFQQFKVLWDRYLSDTQTMVQKRSSKTGHDATYFPYKHVLYVCFYYGKDRSASANWREMDDPKAASNRKCRFKLRLHFDTKVGRYRITKYNGSHSNHQLGKVQVMPKRQSYAASRNSYAAAAAAAQQQQNHQLVPNPAAAAAAAAAHIPAAVRKDDELLKAHSILRTHPLSSLTQLQHQSLGQDILFWQSNSMRELAETNPRLLSLSTLYPVAKEDFVLHLFYAHKDEDKYLVAWTFINCAVQRSAEIALTIFARFNPVTQKQAELVVMNHSIEWVASAINIFCKAIFHLSLDNVHEHLQKRLHSSCDWERIENGAEKLKNCLDLLERVVYAKNESDYAINLKELELAGPASFLEYFYNNWNNKKDFWVYYIQQRTAEALKSSHLEKQESKIENFLTINRKSLTSCISLLMLFGEAPDRLNAHLSLLESQESKPVVHMTPSPADIKPNIVHHSPAHGQPPGNARNFGSVSPSYDPPSYEQGNYKREKRDSDEENPGSPNNENAPSNTEYSPEYGVADRKFGQWKNGDYQNNSPQRTREGTRSGGGGGGDDEETQENTQDCSGSEEESSPVRQSTLPQFPVSRSSNYPAFNPALFPPTPVSPQFLPRHTFMAPPGSFPAPYLHSGSRDFPALTRPMFPPSAHTVPGRDAFNQPIHSPADRESSPFTRSQ